MIEIKILFLGPAKDFAKADSTSLEVRPGATVADARLAIGRRFPRLGSALSTMRIAVNQEFATESTTLRAGDELAVIPPVSGG